MKHFLKGGIIGLVLGVTLAFLLSFSSDAQTPDEDTPYVPYWEYVPQEVDVGPEEKQCDQIVEIVEPSDIRTICWEDTHKVFAEDGVTVRFMLLPAGCVAVVQYRLKLKLDVYQDNHCEILFHNKGAGYRIEDEQETKIGV